MAWTEKLSSGKYRGGYRDSAGRKKYVGPYVRKQDARDAAQEAEVKAKRVAAATEGTLSAKILYGTWWEMSRPERPDSETDLSESIIAQKFLLPRWAGTALNKISRKAVQAWVDELAVGKSPGYTRRIYSVFSASINRAVAQEILTASPCVKIRLPRQRHRPKAYADRAHLDALAGLDEKGRPHLRGAGLRAAVEFGLETGLRPGELCGLHAQSVDVAAGWLWVEHVMIGQKNLIRPWPKDKDARPVPLTARAVEILSEQLTGRDIKTGCGVPHSDGKECTSVTVFLNTRRKALTPRALTQALMIAAKRAGVANKSPYTMRRGFATAAAEGGLDAFALKAIMGHATLNQTDEYVQQTSAARDRLRSALGEQVSLQVLPGARGAASGADLGRQPQNDTEARRVPAGSDQ